MKESYFLPNGKSTNSEKVYFRSWDIIRQDLKSRGLVLHSFDPDIYVMNKEGEKLSTPIYITISIYSKLTGIDFKNMEYK
jgi:hypothetical protein